MLAEDDHRIGPILATALEPSVRYSHNSSHTIDSLGLSSESSVWVVSNGL